MWGSPVGILEGGFFDPQTTLFFWPVLPNAGRFGAQQVSFAFYVAGFLRRSKNPVNSGGFKFCPKPCEIQGKTRFLGPKLAMRWPKKPNTHVLLRVVFSDPQKTLGFGHVGRGFCLECCRVFATFKKPCKWRWIQNLPKTL